MEKKEEEGKEDKKKEEGRREEEEEKGEGNRTEKILTVFVAKVKRLHELKT